MSTVKISQPYCIKSLNLLIMVSLITKEEQVVPTLVTTLSNHLSSIFKFPLVPFALRIFLKIVRSPFEKKYFLLTIMQANCLQVNDLETVKVLDHKRISLLIPDSILCVSLFVTFWTESVLSTIDVFSSFKSILFVLYNLTSLETSP